MSHERALPPGRDVAEAALAELAERLRQVRQSAGLSLRELEREIPVSDSSLSRYLAGQAIPPWAVIEALCRLGRQDPDHLRPLWERARTARLRRRTALPGLRPAPADPDDVPARNDLPRDMADFTGRDAEIRRILVRLDEAGGTGQAAVEAIDGMAGVGKTALAVHVAHLLTARYPDTQLFLDLHGHTAGREPMTPQAALGSLLSALGVGADQIPPDLDARAGMWRAHMARRRAVIVLDNAFSADQVRPLLPGAGHCLVLVTSRRRLLDLESVRSLALDVLPAKDCVAFFAKVVGDERPAAEPDMVDEVVRLCGQLPLAIRIVAARLQHRPAWTVAHLAGLLRDEQRRLAELSVGEHGVPHMFALSYRDLDAGQRRIFRLLGRIGGETFDVRTADLAELDDDSVRQLLEELVDVHLIEQASADRYRLHVLLRSHARCLADADVLWEGAR